MRPPDTNADPTVLALSALVWTLSDAPRAERLLALTGLTTGELRARADEPALLGAVLAFLESHEPDLIACAEALGITPEQIVRAHRELEA